MSRILRRPMFRGGRVNSYGTGIASGLADGGRVGYRNAGFVSGQQIIEANRNNPFFQTNTINPKSRFTLGQSRSGLDNLIRATMFDTEQYPLVGKESGIAGTASLTEFYEAQGNDNDTEGLTASLDTTILPEIKTKTEASEGSIATKKEDEPEIEKPELKKEQVVKTPTVKETEENEVTMTDLERALGLDDARKEYVGDALAAASKAFFEGRGFEAISDAAQVKSKAPEIKRLAGLEEFKAKKAKELYEAQTKAKKFAPGNVEKTVEYLVRQGVPKDEALKRATKQAGTFAEALGKHSVGGTILESGFKLAAEEYYGGDYKGDVTATEVISADKSTELADGVYTDSKEKLIFTVKDKKVTQSRDY
tara:strand:- start:167 stop:1261 length:1095 start_codon:yes stop_codon:yes gene_type:complete